MSLKRGVFEDISPGWVVVHKAPDVGTTTRVHLGSFVDAKVSVLLSEIMLPLVVAAVAAVVDDGRPTAGDAVDVHSRRVGGCLFQR